MNGLQTNDDEECVESIDDENVEKRPAAKKRKTGSASVKAVDCRPLIRFEQAEDEFAIASIASTPYVKRTPAIERSLDAVKADESLQRTLWRAKKISADDDFVEREKNRKRYVSTNATAYVDERSKALLLNHKFALEPNRSTRRADKLKRSNPHEEDDQDAAGNDGQKLRIAHLIAAQVDEIKERMPSSSLMECIHHASSHYYDARSMPQKVRRKKDAAAQASYGMEGACEGSALIAMAVFVEELAAWEVVGGGGKKIVGTTTDTQLITAAHRRLEELRTIRRSQRPQQPSRIQPEPSDEIVKRRKRDLVRDTTIWAYDLD